MSEETKSGDGSPRGTGPVLGAATPLGPPPRVSLPGARRPTSAGPAVGGGGARDADDSGGRRPTDAEVPPADEIDPELARVLREEDNAAFEGRF